jgi:hypothetical protein
MQDTKRSTIPYPGGTCITVLGDFQQSAEHLRFVVN